jgi:hypothetical protein
VISFVLAQTNTHLSTEKQRCLAAQMTSFSACSRCTQTDTPDETYLLKKKQSCLAAQMASFSARTCRTQTDSHTQPIEKQSCLAAQMASFLLELAALALQEVLSGFLSVLCMCACMYVCM